MSKHWFTNNVQQVLAETCPEGFWPGRLPVSDEFRQKMSDISKNRSEAEKAIISKKLSDAYNLRPDQEKEEIKNKIKQSLQNKTTEEKIAISLTISKGLADRSDEAKQQTKIKRQNTLLNRTPEQRQIISKKLSDAYARHTAEEKQQIEIKKARTHAAHTPEFKQAVSKKLSKVWIEKSAEEKANINKKRRATWSKKLGYDVTDPTKKPAKYIKKYESPEAYAEYRKQLWQNRSDEEKQIIIDKRINTIIETYGSDAFTEITKRGAAACAKKTPEEKQQSNEKRKQTLAKKPIEWHAELAQKISEQLQKPETIAKIYETRRKNKTFVSSKPEDQAYNQLVLLMGADDLIRQYKDPRYPFACDFYIKSLDLFIELNLTWTHGQKKFEQTAADIEKLQIWEEKAKTSKFYMNAIDTWTVRDPKKFKYAAQNNLNYFAAYTEQDLLKLYDSLKGSNKNTAKDCGKLKLDKEEDIK